MKWLSNLRRNYDAKGLNPEELSNDPLLEFDHWFKRANSVEQYEPNAIALATVSKDGKPSVRYVLLKNYTKKGFIFYTNYESRKSIQIKANPFGAFVIYWPILQQQIRVEGEIVLLDKKESDKYFDDRPEGSKIGAWASPQSKQIPSREYLEKIKSEYLEKFVDKKIPRPNHWGGFKLIPNKIEFWQGQENRLHDRFEYQLTEGKWIKSRLAP